MRTRQQEITEMLKQKKTNSWTPVGPTRARALGANRLTEKYLGRSRHRVWGPTRWRATEEGSKVIYRDWVNYVPCMQSVVLRLFFTQS